MKEGDESVCERIRVVFAVVVIGVFFNNEGIAFCDCLSSGTTRGIFSLEATIEQRMPTLRTSQRWGNLGLKALGKHSSTTEKSSKMY